MTGDFTEGARPKIVRGRPKAAHTLEAEAAGLSKHQAKTAMRVASIPVAPASNLGALFRTVEPERNARLREFRLASLLLFGSEHALTHAFAAAIVDPDALDHALTELDGLPAIPRRRLLATLASVLP